MPTTGSGITDLSFVIFGQRLRLLVWQSKPFIMDTVPIFHYTLLSVSISGEWPAL